MRLITWNCSRGLTKKLALLDALSADIVVLQECARPKSPAENVLWFGDNPNQGIFVKASGQYSIRALPQQDDVPKFLFPIDVRGPESFVLLAVWSKGKQKYRYISRINKAVELYRDLFEESPTVVMGDFNSNLIWDVLKNRHPKDLNHSALLDRLKGHRLFSSYHTFYGEQQGKETRPTCYLLWNEKKPYHIDYCFIPDGWLNRLKNVEIGNYPDWKDYSDHRPLIVDIL